ncbi:hypothetical protein ACYULU_08190 [Breznakiellaceae bacterium SP9]
MLVTIPVLEKKEAVCKEKGQSKNGYTVTEENWNEFDSIFAHGNKQEDLDALYEKITHRI